MAALTEFCAQILPLLVFAVAIGGWLFVPGRDKGRLAVRAIVGLTLTAALVLLAGFVHEDPRPFVVDPSHPALFTHPADNGFPSDHTAYAAAIALLVALVKPRLGVALLGLSVVAGLARVGANVHHIQDVVGGLLIAAVAVTLTTLLLSRIRSQRPATYDVTDPGQVSG